MECIVCQDTKGKEELVTTPSEEAFRKLLEKERNIDMERWWNW